MLSKTISSPNMKHTCTCIGDICIYMYVRIQCKLIPILKGGNFPKVHTLRCSSSFSLILAASSWLLTSLAVPRGPSVLTTCTCTPATHVCRQHHSYMYIYMYFTHMYMYNTCTCACTHTRTCTCT